MSRKSESNMRTFVIDALEGLHPVAVESGWVCPGIPDLNYLGGWIELKCVKAWPVRESTPLRVDHFENEQRIWLRKRATYNFRAGMPPGSWLLLRVGEGALADWLLFQGDVAADRLGYSTKAELITWAHRWWEGGVRKEDLRAALWDPRLR